jgi:hypothetical protein
MCISIRIFRNLYYHLASRIPPTLLYLGCAMEKTARWHFLKLWQIMYLDITIPWCKFKKNWMMGKFRVSQVYHLNSSVNHQRLTNIKVVSICIQPWRRNIKTGLGIRVLLAQLWRGNIKAGIGIHVVLVQPWRGNIKTELGIHVVLAQQWRGNIKTWLEIRVVLAQPWRVVSKQDSKFVMY